MGEPAILFREDDVLSALGRLRLDYDGLVEAVRSAESERALCTGNDAKGFDLILMNNKVGRSLRETFVGREWEKDETDNQPGILNRDLRLRIIPCNFDEGAGLVDQTPTNICAKGTASSSKTRCNKTAWIPGLDAPEPMPAAAFETYVLGSFTTEDGILRAELSRPLNFRSGRYRLFDPRIILLDGTGKNLAERTKPARGGPTELIDIQITRR